MRWHDVQAAFANALMNPELSVPEALRRKTDGQPNTARFNVYRNNTATSLTDALGDTYPVVKTLVGDEFFQALARAYMASHLPQSPVLIQYGAEMADFIAGFAAAQPLPFLADVARIEWAWLQAYHGEDRESVPVDVLSSVPPENVAGTRLVMHPTLHIIRSPWPAASIWSAHQDDDDEARAAVLAGIAPHGESVLVLRPSLDVSVECVTSEVGDLVQSLADGAELGEAAEQLGNGDAATFGGMLAYIFQIGAVTGLQQADANS